MVHLASDQRLPFDFQLSSITDFDPYEPPAVYYESDHDDQRTWTGEYYRLDLAESTEELLVYVSASRSLEERADGEPFDIRLYFEKRS